MQLKYYLTCDFTKDEAVDKAYLSVIDSDNISRWAAVFIPTDDGGVFKEDYEYDTRDSLSTAISILRNGDKDRLVYGELIDDTNYGEWTVVDCSRFIRSYAEDTNLHGDGGDVRVDATFTPKNVHCSSSNCCHHVCVDIDELVDLVNNV